MQTYTAARLEEDGEYTEHFEANSFDEAEEHCRANGWRLKGVLMGEIDWDGASPLNISLQ